MKPKRASILWTGGKDSALALHEAKLKGYDLVNLVTFAPAGETFRAHPLDFMALQAKALGIPHSIIEIREPFRKSYEDAICTLKKKDGIDILVTGDIAEVDGHPNWIRECSKPSGMEVLTPLWHSDRALLLERLMADGFKVIFSLVKKPWFTEDWVGKPLDNQAMELLHDKMIDIGLDMCGENGEYHTLVLDGPPFKTPIALEQWSMRVDGSLMYIDIHKAGLVDKGYTDIIGSVRSFDILELTGKYDINPDTLKPWGKR